MRFLIPISILFCFSISVHGQIVSTFNSNAEGWTTPNDADGTISYSSTGGNPGGFVSGSPYVLVLGMTTIYVPFTFDAPGTYLGNRSAYYNGTLRYDIQQSTTGAPNQYAEVVITNSAGVSLYYFPPTSNQPPAPPSWATYSVTFNNNLGYWKTTNNSTGSMATEAEVLNILTDLNSLQIRGLYRDANTTNRLDNVSMRPPIVITTQPVPVTVCDGATVSLTTAATGNPSITYQWQIESSPSVWTVITNGGGYSGAGSNTLSINTIGMFGAGSYRCRVSGLAVDDAFTSVATVGVNALPAAPGVTGASSCSSPAALTLTASGGTSGQYRWYTVASGGTPIAGQTNSTYTTPSLSTTTTYYVAINDGSCESSRTAITASILTPPSAPLTTGASLCGSGSISLSASGGTSGQYRWYTVPSGGTPIAGQTNSTYTTPSLSTTTTYYVAINDGSCESSRTVVTASILTPPSAPLTTGASLCSSGSISLSASGGTSGQYRWYTVASGGTPIAGQTNSTYTTPSLSTTTTYYVAINDGSCESSRTDVVAAVLTPPAKPAITSSVAPVGNSITICSTTSLMLSAPTGFVGYLWSNGATTQQISVSTSGNYTVEVLSGPGCSSPLSDALSITVIAAPCTNSPPVIASEVISTQVGGQVSINLLDLISDSDNNVELSTLTIVQPPSSNAPAQIVNNVLEVDYTGIAFSGTDLITIQVCDALAECTQQQLQIEVIGEIEIFNAVSPNSDGKNDFFFIQYIELLPDTEKNLVTIYNRWGDAVFETENYNNNDRVFRGVSNDGKDLPSGTYFYKIEFNSGREAKTGYLSMKR